jgi:hypothetical protein
MESTSNFPYGRCEIGEAEIHRKDGAFFAPVSFIVSRYDGHTSLLYIGYILVPVAQL